ncbi:MAG: hypothetical protein ACQEUZ_06235 [Pseudomonadota bacterium]
MSEIEVGEEHQVGEFFWIDDSRWLGFAENAKHGHGLKNGGSVDERCKVRVLAVREGMAAVVLIRDGKPFGAPAAHGAMFEIPVQQILSWPDKIAAREKHEAHRRDKLAEIRANVGPVLV